MQRLKRSAENLATRSERTTCVCMRGLHAWQAIRRPSRLTPSHLTEYILSDVVFGKRSCRCGCLVRTDLVGTDPGCPGRTSRVHSLSQSQTINHRRSITDDEPRNSSPTLRWQEVADQPAARRGHRPARSHPCKGSPSESAVTIDVDHDRVATA